MPRRSRLLTAPAVLAGTPARAQPYERRGPLPSRDQWLLAQPLLSLPATSPDPLARGHCEARLDGDWGSDFSVVEVASARLCYLIVGEPLSGTLTLPRSFNRSHLLSIRALPP